MGQSRSTRRNMKAIDRRLQNWRAVATQWGAGVLCIIACMYVGVAPIVYNDFWLQAKVGEWIVQNQQIPAILLFPYTEIATETFNAHEWLASLTFYFAIKVWGEFGLPIFLGLLSCIFFASVCLLAWRHNGGNVAAALGCGLLATWAENYRHWLRPELLALLLMVWFWISIDEYLRNRKGAVLIIALVLVVAWTNCHGSFILAPILVGLYMAERVWKELCRNDMSSLTTRLIRQPEVQLFILVTLATLINPFGINMHAFVLQFSTQSYVREYIPEWTSTLSARHSDGRGFYIGITIWILILLRLLVDALQGRKPVLESIIFLAFTVLGVYSIRFLVYVGLVAAFVYSSGHVGSRLENEGGWKLSATVGLAAVLSLLLAVEYGNAYRATPLTPPANVKFTPGLVEVLGNTKHHGNVLNSLELGAELVYRTYPRLRPSIDSRIDSYGLDYIMYQRALLENDALLEEYVRRYDVRYVLLDTVRYGIFSQREGVQRGEWKELYRSSKEVLLMRTDLADALEVANPSR